MNENKDLKQPLVSVILPVFNTRIYLDEAVGSVLDQTMEDLELICINDGSTDGSLDELKKWEKRDPRVRVFSQENKGLSAARNAGFSHAKGTYVYYLDSDDILRPNALKTLVTECEKNHLDVICFSSERIGEIVDYHKLIRKGKYPEVMKGTDLISELVKNRDWFQNVWIQFYRREYLKSICIRYIEGILYEDCPYSFEALLKAERATCINPVLHYQRIRKGSITTSGYSHRTVEDIITICKSVISIIDKETPELKQRMKEDFQSILHIFLEDGLQYFRHMPFSEQALINEKTKEDELFKRWIKEKAEREKISIIAIFHDQYQQAERCLESLVHQIYQNIEIICVDDGSTDGTSEILEKYEQRYGMIRVIRPDEREYQSIALKKAVDAASGGFLLFVDGGDRIERNACDILIYQIGCDPVDILQFRVRSQFDDECPKKIRTEAMKMWEPYFGRLSDSEIVFHCFVSFDLSFRIFGKLYKTPVVKQAFEYLEPIKPKAGNEMYQFFLIAHRAKSFRGIGGKLYHLYGTSKASGSASLSALKECCEAKAAVDAAGRYAKKYDDGILNDAVKGMNDYVFSYCLNECLRSEGIGLEKGFGTLIAFFGAEYVVARLAEKFWDDHRTFADEIRKAPEIRKEQKKIRTIAAYYIRARLGGAERVMMELIRIWKEAGYRVVLLTDKEPSLDDYYSEEHFDRVVLPDYETIRKTEYQKRGEALSNAIKQYNIDLIVYHSWESYLLLWDLLTCKLQGTGFLIHCHNIFSEPLIRNTEVFLNMGHDFTLADGIITLSKTDASYWKMFHDRVFTVLNPLYFRSIEEIKKSPLSGKTIIWCQRFSVEKNPIDVLEVFHMVHESDPDARLIVLGSGDDTRLNNEIEETVKRYSLSDYVSFLGYRKNVRDYYSIADVCIITSEYEGYPLGIMESLGAGVPVVMYEIPYLTIVEQGKGIISVRYRDKEKMATEVLRILHDHELRNRLGREGRETISRMLSYDLEGTWKSIFESIEKEKCTFRAVPLLWDTLFSHIRMFLDNRENVSGTGGLSGRIDDLEKRAGNHEQALTEHEEVLKNHGIALCDIERSLHGQEDALKAHGDALVRHGDELLHHDREIVRLWDEVSRYEETVNHHEEVVTRHNEIVTRHEETLNNHEEVVTRHEDSINHQWGVQKWHEERIQVLEKRKYYCPCCGNRLYNYIEGDFATDIKHYYVRRYFSTPQDVVCPECGSIPRHRILAAWMERNMDLIKGKRILHFALEEGMRRFYNRNDITVQTADLFEEADLNIDIQDTGLLSSSKDVIICNHVLEHVEDYGKALDELKRLLTDDGILIISFSIDKKYRTVYEDASLQTKEERRIAFGQFDHHRIFGRDSKEILESHGFTVGEINGNNMPKEIRPVVGPADYDSNILFLCRRGKNF